MKRKLLWLAMLFLVGVAFVNAEIKNENTECFGKSCLVYSYNRFFSDNGTWKPIVSNFTACGAGWCVANNHHTLIASNLFSTITVSYQGNNVSFSSFSLGGQTPTIALASPSGPSLAYTNIVPTVNYELLYTPEGIKENIILNSPLLLAASLSTVNLTLRVSSPTSTPAFNPSGTVTAGNVHFAAYTAEDANQTKINLPLTAYTNNAGQFFITAQLNTSWFTDPTRAYPVTIDPSIQLVNNNITLDGYNTIINSDNECANTVVLFGACQDPDAVGTYYRGFFTFNTSAIPDGSVVKNVTLQWRTKQRDDDTNFFHFKRFNTTRMVACADFNASAMSVLNETEAVAYYQRNATLNVALQTFDLGNQSYRDVQDLLVQDYFQTGVMIDEVFNNADKTCAQVGSSEQAVSSQRPSLNVTYSSPPTIRINNPLFNQQYLEYGNITLNFTITDIDSLFFPKITIYADHNNTNPNSILQQYLNVSNNTNLQYNFTILPIYNTSDPSLLILWHFDNRTEYAENDTTVHDFGSTNLTAYANTSVITPKLWYNGGKFAGMYQFVASGAGVPGNHFYTAPTSRINNTNGVTNMSFLVWFNFTSIVGGRTLFDNLVYRMENNAPGGPVRFRWQEPVTFTLHTVIMNKSMSADQWHQIVAVLVNESGGINTRIFLDGQLVNQTFETKGKPRDQTFPFFIGAFSFNQLQTLRGNIDEIAIWNRSLTDAEIFGLYNPRNGPYYWLVNATDPDGAVGTASSMFKIGRKETNWQTALLIGVSAIPAYLVVSLILFCRKRSPKKMRGSREQQNCEQPSV